MLNAQIGATDAKLRQVKVCNMNLREGEKVNPRVRVSDRIWIGGTWIEVAGLSPESAPEFAGRRLPELTGGAEGGGVARARSPARGGAG